MALQLGAGEAAASAPSSLGCSKKGETPPKARDGGNLETLQRTWWDGNVHGAWQSPGSRHAVGGKMELLCGLWACWWGQATEWDLLLCWKLSVPPTCSLAEWQAAALVRENICPWLRSALSCWLQLLCGKHTGNLQFCLELYVPSKLICSLYLVLFSRNSIVRLQFVNFKTEVNTKPAEADKNFILVKLVVKFLFTRLRNTVVTKKCESHKEKKKRMLQWCHLEFILSSAREN